MFLNIQTMQHIINVEEGTRYLFLDPKQSESRGISVY